MKILFIGDIVGEPGREIDKRYVPEIIKSENIDFTIANAENAAGGKGLTQSVSEEIFSCGINAITLGNHTFARKEIELIIGDPRILRPLNYPAVVPGRGWNIFDVGDIKIAVINAMGRVYMPLLDCPFHTIDPIIEQISQKTRNIIVDFHAEITSEKQSFGQYLNGKASAVIGTHTHVQTADEQILSEGTAYITDCGMTGPSEGIIGVDREIILKKYLTSLPYKFVVAKGPSMLNGVIIEIDENTGKAKNISRIKKRS